MSETIIIEKNLSCMLRDGTSLCADVYRPASEGTYPVLLARLVDGKDTHIFRYFDIQKAVQSGYAVLLQDVRGRNESEGVFFPLTNEYEDGYDTIEWAASLPFSNGKVGMFGSGYSGFTQVAAASMLPSSLKAIFPAQFFINQTDITHENGIFKLSQTANWSLAMAENEIMRKKTSSDTKKDLWFHWHAYVDQVERFYSFRPIKKWPPFMMMGAGRFFYEFVKDPVIARVSNNKASEKWIPSFFVAGWYDSFLNSTLSTYLRAANDAETPHTLLVGPWSHGEFQQQVGERSFGSTASADSLGHGGSFTDLHLRWFNRWLKGTNNGIDEEAPVLLFVMGINKWRKEKQWPPEQTVSKELYLGKTNGNRFLSFKEQQTFTDAFSYDPNHPVPTRGGSTLFEVINGPREQHLTTRNDNVIVFTSDVLEEPIELIGSAELTLEIKISTESTDLTAKLIDMAPNGTAYNLCDSITEVKKEDKIIQLKLPPTANQFKQGHRIGLEISASNFPQFAPNLNTGHSRTEATESEATTIAISSGNASAAKILLPTMAVPLT